MFFPPSLANLANVSVSLAISFNTLAGETPSALANSPTELIKLRLVSMEAPFIACNCVISLPALAPLTPN